MPTNNLILSGVGSDPEVFLYDWKKGKHVNAVRYIKGTKHEPHLFDDHGRTIQVDTVAAEFTFPPTRTAKSFWKHIEECKKYLESQIPESVTYDLTDSAEFDDEELNLDPAARILGCSASYSAWTCEINNPPVVPERLRSIGCHLHFGLKKKDGSEPSMLDECMIIRACDLFLGVPSILMNNTEESRARRTLYGKAGECRFHDDRVEYRTLGSFLLSDYDYIDWIFNTVDDIFSFVNKGLVYDLDTSADNDIVRCINNGDEELAQRIISKYKIDYPLVHSKKAEAA